MGLVRNARRPRVDAREAWVAVALDIGWVLGSAWLLMAARVAWTPLGRVLVWGVACAVGAFAALQAAGLTRVASRADA